MGQEFHVVRCYSCQTFQVQQVKKSKKWNCKLCGEKQSFMKEFGRGTGADCRRHVQKLNARRGEMLEEEQQKAWSKWEEDRSEATEDCKDRPEDYGEHNLEGQSRWSKYLDEPDKGRTEENAEDEEDETVFMDRNQMCSIRNVNRKRKRTVGWQNSENCYHNGEDDMTTTLESWRAPKFGQTTQTSYPSSFTQVEKSTVPSPTTNVAPSKPDWTTLPKRLDTTLPKRLDTTLPKRLDTTLPKRLDTTTGSSHPVSRPIPSTSLTSTTTDSKVSKWAQYLTPRAPSPEDEYEDGDENYWTSTDEVNSVSHVDRYNTRNSHTAYYGQRTSNISSVEQRGGFLSENATMTLNNIKAASTSGQCGFKEKTNSTKAPTLFSRRQENNEQVCEHPQSPSESPPCRSLLAGSLFNTGEDFDDTF